MAPEEIWGEQEIIDGYGERFAASYVEPTPDFRGGLVRMNEKHQLFETEAEFYAASRPASMQEMIEEKVREVYGLMALAKVLHIEDFRGVAGEKQLVEWKSDASLTVSLMGLLGVSERIENEIDGVRASRVAPKPKKRSKLPKAA